MGRYTRPRDGAHRVQQPQRERHLQDRLIEAARLCGWRVYHCHDSRRSQPGFPDLVMVRAGVLLALELKRGLAEVTAMARSPRGREQLEWIADLAAVPGVRAAVVCPENEDLALGWITEPASFHHPAPVNAP